MVAQTQTHTSVRTNLVLEQKAYFFAAAAACDRRAKSCALSENIYAVYGGMRYRRTGAVGSGDRQRGNV